MKVTADTNQIFPNFTVDYLFDVYIWKKWRNLLLEIPSVKSSKKQYNNLIASLDREKYLKIFTTDKIEPQEFWSPLAYILFGEFYR